MPDNPPEHDHCLECDDPIDVGKKFCSDLCRDKHQADAKKDKTREYLFLAAVIVVLIVVAAVAYL